VETLSSTVLMFNGPQDRSAIAVLPVAAESSAGADGQAGD